MSMAEFEVTKSSDELVPSIVAGAPRHFVTGPYRRQKVFLPDEEYARALDALVKACTDLLLTDERGRVLLGKRCVQPQPDWWYGCGGRMKPGETPWESAARLLGRELSLALPAEAQRPMSEGGRFESVGHYSYVWALRAQEPAANGTADISAVMTIRVTPEEAASLQFDSKEYDEHRWFVPEEVVADDSFHPALRQSVCDLLAARALRKLAEAASSEISDEELGRQLRANASVLFGVEREGSNK